MGTGVDEWTWTVEAVNSSTGLQPCCLYPETDVTVNPSLQGKGCVSKKTNQSVLLFFPEIIDNKAEESFPSHP